MTTSGFTIFKTALGPCGVAWGERGLIGVQLPEVTLAETRRRMRHRFPDAPETPPPPDVQQAIDVIQSLLRGESADLSDIALDMGRVSPFQRRVYQAARTIAAGETASYGEVARLLGKPTATRAVGQALSRNPFPIVVPCHRVLAAGGRTGGFSANGGATTKLRMLAAEAAGTNASASADSGRGVGFDPNVVLARLRTHDAALARVIDTVGPFEMTPKETSSVFGALAEAIVYQQLNGKAAATIYARVRDLFPPADREPTPEQVLAASDEQLRGAGLSRAKLRSLRDLAQKVVERRIPDLVEIRHMGDEEIIDVLTEVRGIGRWTAQMLLMFRLGRPDVLPSDDYALRQGLALALNAPEPVTAQELAEHGQRWIPYRTVASWYLWRLVELTKDRPVTLPQTRR
jgi:methylated-DNA-[protein]-cysteine S-methyltransferase